MSETGDEVGGYALDEAPAAPPLEREASFAVWAAGRPVWIKLQRDSARDCAWLRQHSGLSEATTLSLLADETRPRCEDADGGVLLILRGVNLNPGADPEDMVSLRIWLDERRIVTVRTEHLMALKDVRASFAAGKGPVNSSKVLVSIANALLERLSGVVSDLDDQLDQAEELELEFRGDTHRQRHELAMLRREAIQLRRHLSPQREALVALIEREIPWIEERDRIHLREVADRTMRYVEDLESARERSAVLHEELANRLTERLHRRMYMLSIIAGIFLPLSFVAGVLGANVGGIPGAHSAIGFPATLLLLAGIAALEIALFRWRGWL